jgi:type II secretory pathway component PulK
LASWNLFTVCHSNLTSCVEMRIFVGIHQSNGAVLVLVLVTLLLFSTVVLHVTQRSINVTEEHMLLVQAAQASLQAEAAVDIAVKLVSGNLESIARNDPSSTILEWHEDSVRITLSPANAKVNLNALTASSLQSLADQRLQRAVTQMLQDQVPDTDIQNILIWLGFGHDPNNPETSRRADALYADVQPAYTPRKAPMQRPEELILVIGLESLEPAWIQERFTVWGQDARVNLNFASRDVLLALLPELENYWPAIAQYRTEHGFMRTDELLSRIRLPMHVYQRILPHITLHSDIHEALVEVRQPAWYERHRIILEQNAILTQDPVRILARDILESRPLGNMWPLDAEPH